MCVCFNNLTKGGGDTTVRKWKQKVHGIMFKINFRLATWIYSLPIKKLLLRTKDCKTLTWYVVTVCIQKNVLSIKC